MKMLTNAALIVALTLPSIAPADERPDHYEGEPAESLEQALENLSEYNARLAAILDKNELAAADHGKIHELTYTLENALARIREEVDDMAIKLESIHVASEERDSTTIRAQAPDYLSAAGKFDAR